VLPSHDEEGGEDEEDEEDEEDDISKLVERAEFVSHFRAQKCRERRRPLLLDKTNHQ
jgi:hypothetical protein